MKQTLATILTALLLCTVLCTALPPYVLAAETSDAYTDMLHVACDDTNLTQLHNELDINIISGTAQKEVLTATPAAITITNFDEPDRTDAVAFAAGTSQEDLFNWFADSVTGFTGYDADGNPYDLISGAWSLDAVDPATTGLYYAFTSPSLGTDYILADGVSLPRQRYAISIQTIGEPDINCYVAGRGFLHFPWVLSAAQEEQLDSFNLWMRQDGGEWNNLSDGFLFVSDGLRLSQKVFTYGSTYELKVTYPGGQTGVLTFEYNTELTILDYSTGDRDGGDVNGGGSGTGTQPAPTTPQTPSDSPENNNQDGGNDSPAPGDFSPEVDDTPQNSDTTSEDQQKPPPQSPSDSQYNEIHTNDSNSQIPVPVKEKPVAITPDEETESAIPVFSNSFFTWDTKSNSSEPENNTISQPRDSTKEVINTVPDDNNTLSENSAAAEESASVTEFYSPTQTIISGTRLKELCKEEESVVFGSLDLTVSIPSKLLLALNLSDLDTLTVTLTQPESNQILLAVDVSGKSVTKLSGTVLRLRYKPHSEYTDITIQNDAGELITVISYDGQLLRFAADASGTYTITEQLSPQEAQKSTSMLILVLGGLILAAGGITFFRRRHHE